MKSHSRAPVWLQAFPMHGLHKMTREGFRTRDAHLLEWFAQLCPTGHSIDVHSRPEPPALRLLNQRVRANHSVPEAFKDRGRTRWRVPSLAERRSWWLSSLSAYSPVDAPDVPTISWNPLLPLTNAWTTIEQHDAPLHVDLLDNWLIHPAYEFMQDELRVAYQRLLERATSVSANSEGTLKLASEFGRSDAVLIPNGCDPERFTGTSSASGPTTVGYIGKMGSRVDLGLIRSVAEALPTWKFVFAGQILEQGFEDELTRLSNVRYLGDVPYREVPRLLATFDIGWVPHAVGASEIGGDAIKIYEYRAAGLPVVTTPIIGTRERPLVGVHVADGSDHAAALQSLAQTADQGPRIPRVLAALPDEIRWESKARTLVDAMGLA